MSALLVSFEDFVSFKVAFKPPTKWKGVRGGGAPSIKIKYTKLVGG